MTRIYAATLVEPSSEIAGRFDLDRIRGRWSDEDDGAGCDGRGRGESVILTGDGRIRWVLEHWTNWAGEAPRFERLAPEDAREWLERNGFGQAVTEHFGGSLDDALHDLRAYREITARRDEIVRAAFTAGATKSQIAAESGISRMTVDKILEGRPASPPLS